MVRETRYLIVRNLPDNCTEDIVIDHFQRYGKIQSVKLQTGKDNDADSTATVAFNDIKSAAKAHHAKNCIGEVTLRTDYWEGSTSSTPVLTSGAGGTPAVGSATVRSAVYTSATPASSRHSSTFASWTKGPSDDDGASNHDKGDNSQVSVAGNSTVVAASPALDKLSSTAFDLQRGRGRAKQKKFGQKFDKCGGSFGRHGTTTSTRSLEAARSQSEAAAAAAASASNQTTISLSGSSINSGSAVGLNPIIVSDTKETTNRDLKETNRESSSRSRPHSVASPSSRNSGLKKSHSHSRSASRSRSRSRGSRSSSSRSHSSGTSQSTSPHRSHTSSSTARPQSMVVSSRLVNSEVKEVKKDDNEERKPLGICIMGFPTRSSDSSLRDGLYHEYKKQGKVTTVQICGDGKNRYAIVSFRKPEDAVKALEASQEKVFFGIEVKVVSHEGVEVDDADRGNDVDTYDEYQVKSTRTLFVGNLEKETTTQDLIDKFQQFGDIIDVDIKRQGATTAFAFVQYADISSVVQALRAMEGEHIGVNKIKLGFGKSMPTDCVWLDCLPSDANSRNLRAAMTRYGEVLYCYVDKCRHKGLVYFSAYENAQHCVTDIKSRPHFSKKKLQVDFASRECQNDFFERMERTDQLRANERPDESNRAHRFRQQRSFDSFQDEGSPTAYSFNRTSSNVTSRNGRSSSGSSSFRRGRQYTDSNFQEDSHSNSRRSRRQDEYSQSSQFYGSKGSSDDYDAVLREYGHSQRERRERDLSPRHSADRRGDSQSRQSSRDHSLDRYEKDRTVEIYNSRDTSPGSGHSESRYRPSREDKYSSRDRYDEAKVEDKDFDHHRRMSRTTSPHTHNHSSSHSHDSDYEHRGGSCSQSPPTPIREDSIHRMYYGDDYSKRSVEVSDDYSYPHSHKQKEPDDAGVKSKLISIHSSKLGAEVLKTASKSRKRIHEESVLSEVGKLDSKCQKPLFSSSDRVKQLSSDKGKLLATDKGKLSDKEKKHYLEASRQVSQGHDQTGSPGSSGSRGDSENGSVSEGDLHHLHQEKHHILRKLQELNEEGIGTSDPDSPRSVSKIKSVAVKEALRLSGRSHEDRKSEEVFAKGEAHRKGAQARGVDSRRDNRGHLSSEDMSLAMRQDQSIIDQQHHQESFCANSDSDDGSELRRMKKRRAESSLSVKSRSYRRDNSVEVSDEEDLALKSDPSLRLHSSSGVTRASCDSRVGSQSYIDPSKMVELVSCDSGDTFKAGFTDPDISVIQQSQPVAKSNTYFHSKNWSVGYSGTVPSPIGCFSPACSDDQTQDSIISESLTEKSSEPLSPPPSWQHSASLSLIGKDITEQDYGYFKDFTIPDNMSPDDCLSDDSVVGGDLLLAPGEPSVEERIRAIDEMLNMSISNKSSEPSLLMSVLSNKDITNNNDNTALYSKFRIRKREGALDSDNGGVLGENRKPEPSVIMQQVLSKKSILDQDFQRLEQMCEKYDTLAGREQLKADVASPKLLELKADGYLKPVSSPSLLSLPSLSQPVTTSSSMLQPTVTTSVAGCMLAMSVTSPSFLLTSPVVSAPIPTCSIQTLSKPAALDTSRWSRIKSSDVSTEVSDKHSMCTNVLTLKQDVIVSSSSSLSILTCTNNSLSSTSSQSISSTCSGTCLQTGSAPVTCQQSCELSMSTSSLPPLLLPSAVPNSCMHSKTNLQHSMFNSAYVSPLPSSLLSTGQSTTSGLAVATPFTQGADKAQLTPTVGQEAPHFCSPSFTPENLRTSVSCQLPASKSPRSLTQPSDHKELSQTNNSKSDLTVTVCHDGGSGDSTTEDMKTNTGISPDIESPISVQSESSSIASVPFSSIDTKIHSQSSDDKSLTIPPVIVSQPSHTSDGKSLVTSSHSAKTDIVTHSAGKTVVDLCDKNQPVLRDIMLHGESNKVSDLLMSRQTEISAQLAAVSVSSKERPDAQLTAGAADTSSAAVASSSGRGKVSSASSSLHVTSDIDSAPALKTATTLQSSLSSHAVCKYSLDKTDRRLSGKLTSISSKSSAGPVKAEALFAPDVKMEQVVKAGDNRSDSRHVVTPKSVTVNKSSGTGKKSTKDSLDNKDIPHNRDSDKGEKRSDVEHKNSSVQESSKSKHVHKGKDKRDQSQDSDKCRQKDKEDNKKKEERKTSEKKAEKKTLVSKDDKKTEKKSEDKKDKLSGEKVKGVVVKPSQTKHLKVDSHGSKSDKKHKEKIKDNKEKSSEKKMSLVASKQQAVTDVRSESKHMQKTDSKETKSGKQEAGKEMSLKAERDTKSETSIKHEQKAKHVTHDMKGSSKSIADSRESLTQATGSKKLLETNKIKKEQEKDNSRQHFAKHSHKLLKHKLKDEDKLKDKNKPQEEKDRHTDREEKEKDKQTDREHEEKEKEVKEKEDKQKETEEMERIEREERERKEQEETERQKEQERQEKEKEQLREREEKEQKEREREEKERQKEKEREEKERQKEKEREERERQKEKDKEERERQREKEREEKQRQREKDKEERERQKEKDREEKERQKEKEREEKERQKEREREEKERQKEREREEKERQKEKEREQKERQKEKEDREKKEREEKEKMRKEKEEKLKQKQNEKESVKKENASKTVRDDKLKQKDKQKDDKQKDKQKDKKEKQSEKEKDKKVKEDKGKKDKEEKFRKGKDEKNKKDKEDKEKVNKNKDKAEKEKKDAQDKDKKKVDKEKKDQDDKDKKKAAPKKPKRNELAALLEHNDMIQMSFSSMYDRVKTQRNREPDVQHKAEPAPKSSFETFKQNRKKSSSKVKKSPLYSFDTSSAASDDNDDHNVDDGELSGLSDPDTTQKSQVPAEAKVKISKQVKKRPRVSSSSSSSSSSSCEDDDDALLRATKPKSKKRDKFNEIFSSDSDDDHFQPPSSKLKTSGKGKTKPRSKRRKIRDDSSDSIASKDEFVKPSLVSSITDSLEEMDVSEEDEIRTTRKKTKGKPLQSSDRDERDSSVESVKKKTSKADVNTSKADVKTSTEFVSKVSGRASKESSPLKKTKPESKKATRTNESKHSAPDLAKASVGEKKKGNSQSEKDDNKTKVSSSKSSSSKTAAVAGPKLKLEPDSKSGVNKLKVESEKVKSKTKVSKGEADKSKLKLESANTGESQDEPSSQDDKARYALELDTKPDADKKVAVQSDMTLHTQDHQRPLEETEAKPATEKSRSTSEDKQKPKTEADGSKSHKDQQATAKLECRQNKSDVEVYNKVHAETASDVTQTAKCHSAEDGDKPQAEMLAKPDEDQVMSFAEIEVKFEVGVQEVKGEAEDKSALKGLPANDAKSRCHIDRKKKSDDKEEAVKKKKKKKYDPLKEEELVDSLITKVYDKLDRDKKDKKKSKLAIFDSDAEESSAQNETPSKSLSSQNETPSKSLSSQNETPSKSLSSQNETPSKSLSSQNETPSKSLSSQNETPSKSLSSQNETPSKSLSSQNETPSKSLSSQNETPSKSLSSQNETPSKSLSSQNETPSKSLSSQNETPSKSLSSQNETPSKSLSSQNETSSKSLSSQNETPSKSLSSQNETPSKSLSSQNEVQSKSVSSQNETPSKSVSSPNETPSKSLYNQNETPNKSLSNQNESPSKSVSSQNETPSKSVSSQNETPRKPVSSQNETPSKSLPNLTDKCSAQTEDLRLAQSASEKSHARDSTKLDKCAETKAAVDQVSVVAKKKTKQKKDKTDHDKESCDEAVEVPTKKDKKDKQRVDSEVRPGQKKVKCEKQSDEEHLKPPKKKKKKDHDKEADRDPEKALKVGRSPEKKSETEKIHCLVSADHHMSEDQSSSQFVDEFTSFWGHPKPILIPRRLKDSQKSDDEKVKHKDERKTGTSGENSDALSHAKDETADSQDVKLSPHGDKISDASPTPEPSSDVTTTPKVEHDTSEDLMVPISEAETTVITEAASVATIDSLSSMGESLIVEEETIVEVSPLLPDETTIGSSLEIHDDDDFPSLVIDDVTPSTCDKKVSRKDKKLLRKQQVQEFSDHMDEVIAHVAMDVSSSDEDGGYDQELLLSDVINQELKYEKISSDRVTKPSLVTSILFADKEVKGKSGVSTSCHGSQHNDKSSPATSVPQTQTEATRSEKTFGQLDEETKNRDEELLKTLAVLCDPNVDKPVVIEDSKLGPSTVDIKKKETADKKKAEEERLKLEEEKRKIEEEERKKIEEEKKAEEDRKKEAEEEERRKVEEEKKKAEEQKKVEEEKRRAEAEKKKAEEEEKRKAEEEKTRREKEEQALREASDEAARAVESLLEFQSGYEKDSVDMDDDLPPLFIEPADKETPMEIVTTSTAADKTDLVSIFSRPVPEKVTANLDDKLLEKVPTTSMQQPDTQRDSLSLFASPSQAVASAPMLTSPRRNSSGIKEKTPEPITSPQRQTQQPSAQMHSPHRIKFLPQRSIQSPHNLMPLPQNPMQTAQNPMQTAQNPMQTAQNPMQTVQSLMQTSQNPIQTVQNPIQTVQNPIQTAHKSAMSPQMDLNSPQPLLQPQQRSPFFNKDTKADGSCVVASLDVPAQLDISPGQPTQRRVSAVLPTPALLEQPLRAGPASPRRKSHELLPEQLVVNSRRKTIAAPEDVSVTHLDRGFPTFMRTDGIFSKERAHSISSLPPPVSISLDHAPHDSNSQSPMQSLNIPSHQDNILLSPKKASPVLPVFQSSTSKSNLPEPAAHFSKALMQEQMFAQYQKCSSQEQQQQQQVYYSTKSPTPDLFRPNKVPGDHVLLHAKCPATEKPILQPNRGTDSMLMPQKNTGQDLVLQHPKGAHHILEQLQQHEKNLMPREQMFSPKAQPDNSFNYPDQNIDFLLNSPPRNNLTFQSFPQPTEVNLPPVAKQPDYSQEPLFIATSEAGGQPTDRGGAGEPVHVRRTEGFPASFYQEPKIHHDKVTVSLQQQSAEDDKKGARKRKRNNKKTTSEDRAAALAEQQAIEESVQANVDSIRKALNANQAKAAAEKAHLIGNDKKKTLDAYDFEAHIGQDLGSTTNLLASDAGYSNFGEADSKPLRSRNERGRGRGTSTRRGRRGRGGMSSVLEPSADAHQRGDSLTCVARLPNPDASQAHVHMQQQPLQQFAVSQQQHQQASFQRQTAPGQGIHQLSQAYPQCHPSPVSSDNSSSLPGPDWAQQKPVSQPYSHSHIAATPPAHHQQQTPVRLALPKNDVLSPESNRQDLDLSYGESELVINLDEQPSSTEGKENQYSHSSDGEERSLIPSPSTPKSQRSTRARKQTDYKAIASGNLQTPTQPRSSRSSGSPRGLGSGTHSPRGLGNGANSPRSMSPRTRSTENMSSSPVVKLEKLEVGRTTRSRREAAAKGYAKDDTERAHLANSCEDQKPENVAEDIKSVSKENIYEFVDNEQEQLIETSLRSARARKKRVSDQEFPLQPQQPQQPLPDYMPASPLSASHFPLVGQEPRHAPDLPTPDLRHSGGDNPKLAQLSHVDAIIDAVSKGNFGSFEDDVATEPPPPPTAATTTTAAATPTAVSESDHLATPPSTRSNRRSTDNKKELDQKAEKTFVIAEAARLETRGDGTRRGPTVPPLRIKVAHGAKVEKCEEKHYVIERVGSGGCTTESDKPPLAFTVKLSDTGTAIIKPAAGTSSLTSQQTAVSTGKSPLVAGDTFKNDNLHKKDSTVGLFSGLPQNEQHNGEPNSSIALSQAPGWKSMDTVTAEEATVARSSTALHPKVAAKVQASHESQISAVPIQTSAPQPVQHYPPASIVSTASSHVKSSPVTPAASHGLKHVWSQESAHHQQQQQLMMSDPAPTGSYLAPGYHQTLSQMASPLPRETQQQQQLPIGTHPETKQPPNAHAQPLLRSDRPSKTGPGKPGPMELNPDLTSKLTTAADVQKHQQAPFGFAPQLPTGHSGQRPFIMATSADQAGSHLTPHFPASALLKSGTDSRPAKSPSIPAQVASKLGAEVRTQTPPVAPGAMLFAGVVSGQPHSLSPSSASPEGQVIERIQNPIRQAENSQSQSPLGLHLPGSHHPDPVTRFMKDEGLENSVSLGGHSERAPSREMAMYQQLLEHQRLQQHLMIAEAARNSVPDQARNIAAVMRNALESSRNTPAALDTARKGSLPTPQSVAHGQPLNLTPQPDPSRVTPKSTPPAPQSPFPMQYFERKPESGRLPVTVAGSFMQPSPGAHREGLAPHLYPELSLANLPHSSYMVGRLPIDPRIYASGQQPPAHLMREGVLSGSFPPAFPPGSRFPGLEHSEGKKNDPSHLEQGHMLRSPSPIQRQLQADALRQQLTRVPCDLPTRDSPVGFLQRYPVMWQGALALKNDNSYVQMHFIAGNRRLPNQALPQPMQNGALPPLRISQRMRLEHAQLEGVAKRMQCEDHYCILIAVACGRDQLDINQQTRALNEGFITYLLSKQAAGIVNVPLPGSEQVRFVVHIFPPCEFVDNSVAQQGSVVLMEQLREVPHAVVIIATT